MERARMSKALEGFPGDQVQYDVEGGTATVRVDATIYPLEAVYGAAYVFIDRCWVLLDRDGEGRLRVSLTPKKTPSEESARALLGELGNELLSCAWRAQIAKESRSIIEAATTRALAGARGAPTLDDLESFDFSDESFDDPLGIAMSWEEKYGKKKADAGGAPAPTEGAPEAAKVEEKAP
jgi:His-Xaa-Ser system protein HxsD